MKHFSILQAVYKNDDPLFLDECFNSIYSSTLLPERIVLVKDGSIPSPLESIISTWSNKLPIYTVGYEKNKGLAAALNFGLQYIETEYTARMDSDDYCFPTRFEEQLLFIKAHPECEICGTGLSEFYIDKTGYIIKKDRLYPFMATNKSKNLYRGTPIGHPTVMIKTELLKKFHYNEHTCMNEDIDLWFRLLKSGTVIYNIQKPLLNFRITDGTFKRRSKTKAFNELKIYITNLYSFFGFSPRLIIPILRYFTRFMPYQLNKKLYLSKIRHFFLQRK